MADAATLSRTRARLGLSLPLLLGLLVYGQIISHPSAVLGDPDTYWHIATGRWILAQGAVPHQDVFSFSMPGAPWDPPGWLAENLHRLALRPFRLGFAGSGHGAL